MKTGLTQEQFIDALPDLIPQDVPPDRVGEAVREVVARLAAGPIEGGQLLIPTDGGTLTAVARGDLIDAEFIPYPTAVPATP